MASAFWLSDEQMAAIQRFLPMVHTGPKREDDRRVISGILYRFREGCRWRALPMFYGPYTTVYNRFNRWSKRGLWQEIFAVLTGFEAPAQVVMVDSTAVKAHRSASGARGGEHRQAIGRSRGGRTTKIHALVDDRMRPRAFVLTGGQVADIKGAATLLSSIAASRYVIGDKAYDADHLIDFLQKRGTTPVIPNKANRKNCHAFDSEVYKERNIIERCFGRLKDFRAIATRYDKLARNFLAGLCLAAACVFWIN